VFRNPLGSTSQSQALEKLPESGDGFSQDFINDLKNSRFTDAEYELEHSNIICKDMNLNALFDSDDVGSIRPLEDMEPDALAHRDSDQTRTSIPATQDPRASKR